MSSGPGGEAGAEAAARPDLPSALELTPLGDRRYRAGNVATGVGGVVFGGQLLGQTIVAAATADPSKEVKTVHTVFARGASPDRALDVHVEPVHLGRALGSVTVTVAQGDRVCSRSLVLLSTAEPDLVRHADPAPAVEGPEKASPSRSEGGDWEVRVVGGVDVADPDAVGPPELFVWSRFRAPVTTGVVGQALLAYATDGFLIGTAMRPHPGVGQALAHTTVSTSVLSHTLTFHEPVDAGRWHLLAHRSPYAGRGRSYGRADVFSEDGLLVASFVQDNMIRAFP
ncbi:MAG TPA: acyl-CoA thioesterase domain-containing protein, partial [Acidimicrobiales bacterium]|nr:acyl-CoA thioesterase domain-containing protein [Acidimicrobiales bacterium]